MTMKTMPSSNRVLRGLQLNSLTSVSFASRPIKLVVWHLPRREAGINEVAIWTTPISISLEDSQGLVGEERFLVVVSSW